MLTQLFVEPFENVFIYIGVVALVEHLMPSSGIEAHENIGKPGVTERLVRTQNALAVFTDRVAVSGEEHDRLVLVHLFVFTLTVVKL